MAAAPARPPKANTTDLASRVMPLKKGGFDQLYNLQALAGRRQVIVAIGTHDSTADTGALHPLLEQGAANLAAAGIADTIGKALFDAGYASEANFTAPCERRPVRRRHPRIGPGRQTRRGRPRRRPAPGSTWPPSWTPPKAGPSTSSAKPSSSPSSPSCSPASAAP